MKIQIDNFDLKQIADSGQCFRWRDLSSDKGVIYEIPAFGKVLRIKQVGNIFDFSCNKKEFNYIWEEYLDLKRDYSDIKRRIDKSNDLHLKEAFEIGSGIRILKQDLWEIIFSFMISQNNNIKRIKKSIELVCERCGYFSENSDEIFRFPNAEEIPLEIFDDNSLGLGYRAPYLKGLCQYVLDNPTWINDLKSLSYEDAFNSLLKIKGIGVKVANCICLFGLGHVSAFPIDTHVKQLLAKYYPDGIDLSLYPDEAGIIQQYLFYFELLNN